MAVTDKLDSGVDGVLDVVRAHAEETEKTGRLPDAVVASLRASGLYRMVLPSVLGGEQVRPSTFYEVVERISAVDGSTGWCAAIGAGTNIFAGYMTEAGARAVFADPDAGNASIFAPMGMAARDGEQWRLSGRWPFSSNCLHSGWIAVGAFVEGTDRVVEPEPRLVFVPVADVSVHETWDAPGLRGTGSHDTSVDGLLIDMDRSLRFSGTAWPSGPLWRVPLFTFLVPTLVVVMLGIARGALDELARQVVRGRASLRGPLADDAVAMADYATAEAALRAARAGLWEALDEVWTGACDSEEPAGRVLIARVLLACNHCADVAVEVAGTAHRLGGGAAAYSASPLSRAFRDAVTARQHVIFAHGHRVGLGKLLAGLDATVPPFIM